ncbi:hypothetical protein [Bacteroides sp. 51]|uniref:hypothetical protein n=1 Tax=Bacteroides sp. 51 TaxID=2302938 RepID=UPI0013D07F4E|nr:hypothetical protein [Bacteroides sp. 51]NDV82023.1 hypothetical protein [Bacteroides sp. 51]
MSKEERFLIQSRVQKLVSFLMRDFKLSLLDAFATVYNSELYDRLVDTETGLYYESSTHVYSYLKNEIKRGKID